MKELNYISVATKSDNSGDEYIQKCFFEEFNNIYTFNEIIGNHEKLNGINIDIGDIIMSSSNLLKLKEDFWTNNNGSWKMKGYNFNNIIPVSIGTGNTNIKKWDIGVTKKISNKIFPIKIIIIGLAYSIGPLVEYFYNMIFFNKFWARRAIKKAIHKTAPIACRTHEAEAYLNNLGFNNTYPTGCVTLWSFDEKIIQKIDNTRKDNVIVAFGTEELHIKNKVIEELKKHYDKVVVWHQNYSWQENADGDEIIANDWIKFGELLNSGEYEYIGSRLHAGVFAMKSGVRAMFVAVDHRVINFSKIIGLKYVKSSDWLDAVTLDNIKSDWSKNLKPTDKKIIDKYKVAINDYVEKEWSIK